MAEIPLSVDPSKSTQPIRDLAEALQDVQSQTVATEKQFKDTFGTSTKAVDTTTNAIDEQTKAQRKSADAVDATKKGVVDFSKKSKQAYDDKPVDEYKKSVDQAEKSTDDLDDATTKFGNNGNQVFGELKEGVGEFAGSLTGIVSGGPGGLVGGFQGLLNRIGPIGLGIGAIVGGVGLIGNEVLEVDKKFDALRGTVEQLFKVTGEEADRIVINTEAIADTFDQDVNEVILATNTLVKEFGISGEEATNILAKGFNSTANAQGDLIDAVKEFSSQVRASGGDVDDLFSVLQKSNEEGIFSDKGIDVVKEFGLRIREQTQGTVDALTNAFGADFANNLLQGVNEGTISSIDALAMVSGELGNLSENSAIAQTVIADVFGGAGEDAGFRFLTLLEDINDEQGFGNDQLTESQKRTQENLEANQRLAGAQNELSKAIADGTEISRIWTEVQIVFVNILLGLITIIENVIEAFRSWENFTSSLVDTTLELGVAFKDMTDEEVRSIKVRSEAIQAIRNFGKESANLVQTLEKSFDALANGNITETERLKIVQQLNEEYPEQIGNVDLLTASEGELLKIKQDIIKSEIEADIQRKKRFALDRLDLELQIRREKINLATSDAERKRLIEELEIFEKVAKQRIDDVEEQVKIQVGLIKDGNDEILENEEDLNNESQAIDEEAKKQREKQQSEFNKAIQDILKRGNDAILNDQFVSEEERILRQRDFQRQELNNLLEHARDLNEALTGSRELDQEVIDAFNRADEKLITDAEDKIQAIKDRKRREELAKELKQGQDLLAVKQQRFDQEIALLQSQEAEEIAIIEQQERRRGESELEFQNRIELQKLQAQEFFLDQRLQLIERERSLKLNSLTLELQALEGKEGEEIELKRQALEEKKALLEQETNTQKEQLNLQLKNTRDAIDEIESSVPSLGDVFNKVNEQLAESLGLSSEQIQAITDAVQQVASEIFNTIQKSVEDQIDANDEVLSKLEEREERVKESLEREIEFAQLGYASNVLNKRAELAQIEEAERDAQKRREELLKQQQVLDEISQTTSLITASANLYKSLSVLPFGIGIAIATALTGAMFSAFIASKAKAQSVTSLAEGGHGDDTGMIKGRRHAQGGEQFLDHVEVEDGERWSVFNRRGSRKYADLIREFTEAVNTDKVTPFMHKQKAPQVLLAKTQEVKGNELELQALTISSDLSDNLSDITAIKKALENKFNEPKTHFYQDKDGNTIKMDIKSNGSKKKTKLS